MTESNQSTIEYNNKTINVLIIDRNNNNKYFYKLEKKLTLINSEGQTILPETENYKTYSVGYYSRLTDEFPNDSDYLNDDDEIIKKYISEVKTFNSKNVTD